MQQVQEIIEQVTNTLSDIAQSDVVVGNPLEVGTVTVVPISRVTAGFGGAGGEGEGETSRDGAAGKNPRKEMGTGRGGGSGGGAVVRPIAVAVFRPEGVDVLPIPEKQGKLEKFLEQIPDLIDRFKKSDDD